MSVLNSSTFERLRNVAQKSVAVLLADLAYRMSNTILLLLIARCLGTSGTGLYTLGTAFQTVFQLLTLSGTGYLVIRETAHNPGNARSYLTSFAALRGSLGLISLLALYMWVVIAQPSVSKAMLMMLIMVIGILPESIRETMRAGFVGQGKITPYAGIATVTGVSRIIVGGGGIFQGWGIETIAFLVVVSDLITNLSGFLILLAGSSYESRRGLHLSIMYQQLRASLPFLAIYTLLVIDGQANVFLLAFFKDESQVGLYGVANTIVIAFTLITQVYLSIALPILTRLYSSDHTRLRLSHSFALWVFMSAALPIALMITFQARDVSALFGRQFESETPVIGVLIWAMVFSWLNAPNSCIMLAAHQESVSAKYLLISLVVGFVLGLVFVPLLGAYGAALGRVGAGFLFWFMHSRFVHQNLVRIPIRFLTGSLLAVLAMAVVACSLGAIIDFWSALLVSLIVYVTILFIGCRKTLSDWYCEWRTCSQR